MVGYLSKDTKVAVTVQEFLLRLIDLVANIFD